MTAAIFKLETKETRMEAYRLAEIETIETRRERRAVKLKHKREQIEMLQREVNDEAWPDMLDEERLKRLRDGTAKPEIPPLGEAIEGI